MDTGLLIFTILFWIFLLVYRALAWHLRRLANDDDEQNYDVEAAAAAVELSTLDLNECNKQLATFPIIIYKKDNNDSQVILKSTCMCSSHHTDHHAVTEDHNDHSRSVLKKSCCMSTVTEDNDSSEEKIKNSSTSCVICLDEIEEGETVRSLPKCRHMFHQKCIDPWFIRMSSFCPVCRTRVIKRTVEPRSFHWVNIYD